MSLRFIYKVGGTALVNAAALNYTEMVRLLLDKGANKEAVGKVTSAFHRIGHDTNISLISR